MSTTEQTLPPENGGAGKPDLDTLGGRVQHIRFALYGSVNRRAFGRIVADYEGELSGLKRKPYWSGTVGDWEGNGAVPGLYAALAIASIGQVTIEWLACGVGTTAAPSDEDPKGISFRPPPVPPEALKKA